MKITTFDFEQNLVNDFIDFPWSIYKNNPNWHAPSKDNLRKQFSLDYPFYKHGIMKNFLSYGAGGKITGRISAIINHNLHSEIKTGHIGFFECIEDYETARNLLNHAVDFLRSNHVKRIWGPINFATLYPYRLLTKGFEKPSFYSDIYTPHYYSLFFERYGFKPLKTYYSDFCHDLKSVLKRYSKFKKRFEEMGFRTRTVKLDDFENELKLLNALLFEIFKNNFAFSPMDYEEYLHIYGKYNQMIQPEHLRFAYSPDNKPAGFFLAYPDFTGNYPKTFISKMMGVLPEYAYAGVGMALLCEMIEYYIKQGFQYSIASLRIEGNSSLKFGEGIYEDFKEYVLYELYL